METLVDQLRNRLLQPLPGQKAQFEMAPSDRSRAMPQVLSDFRHAAVIVLICQDEQGTFIPLTERFVYEGVHSGQVSLPGGKPEGAETLGEAALRECFEEIGVKEIDLLGELTPLYIPVSKFLVTPVVGYHRFVLRQFVPHEREVRSVIRLRLPQLLDGGLRRTGTMRNGRQAPYLLVDGFEIWGATAMILWEVREVLRTIS